jgi:hypothetical protein
VPSGRLRHWRRQEPVWGSFSPDREASAAVDGTGLEQFLEASGNYQAEHSGCLPRLWDTDHEMVKTARRLIAGLLLTEAKKCGRVRKDLTTTDLTVAMFSLRGVIETTIPVAPDADTSISSLPGCDRTRRNCLILR